MFLSSSLIGYPASHVKNVNPLRLEENGKGSWISVFPTVRCTLGFQGAKHFPMLKIILIYGEIKKTALSKKWLNSTWLWKGQKKKKKS